VTHSSGMSEDNISRTLNFPSVGTPFRQSSDWGAPPTVPPSTLPATDDAPDVLKASSWALEILILNASNSSSRNRKKSAPSSSGGIEDATCSRYGCGIEQPWAGSAAPCQVRGSARATGETKKI